MSARTAGLSAGGWNAAAGRLDRMLPAGVGTALAALAAVLSGVALTALAAIWGAGRRSQAYNDVIAGEVGLSDYDKSGELSLGALYLLVLIASFVCWLAFFRRRAGQWRISTRVLRFPRLPPVAVLAGVALAALSAQVHPGTSPLLHRATWLAVVLGLMTYLRNALFGAGSAVDRTVHAAVLAAVLLATVISVGCLLTLTGISEPQVRMAGRPDLMLIVTTTGAGILALLPIHIVKRLVVLTQAMLPLAVAVPAARLYDNGGAITSTAPRWTLALAVGAAAVALGATQLRWVLRHTPRDGYWGPATPVTLAILMSTRALAVNSTALGDDFHVGESLVQWQQIVRFGARPFRDYIPVPGLSGAVGGAVNAALFEGTLSSYPASLRVVGCLVAVALVGLVAGIAGRGWAVASVLVTPVLVSDRVWVPILLLLLLAQPGLLRRPGWWLAVDAVAGAVAVLLMPSTGATAALATVPVAAVMLAVWIARLRTERNIGRALVPLAAAAAVLLPAASMLLDVVRYLRLSQSSNVLAYGLGLHQFPDVPPYDFGGVLPSSVAAAAFEAVRFGAWLFVLPALLALGVGALRRRRAGLPATPAMALIAMTAAFVVGVAPYAWGRIDPQALSRPGLVSLAALSLLLPLCLALLGTRARAAGALLLAMSLPLATLTSQWSPTATIGSALSPAQVPGGWVATNGDDVGLSALGRHAWLPPDRLEEALSLQRALDEFAGPRAPYYDFTNRAALYALLGRASPTAFTGEYYAADERLQRAVLRQLEGAPPVVALADTAPSREPRLPDPAPIAMSASVRSYRIYRWFLEQHYQPVLRSGALLLVRADRRPAGAADATAADALQTAFRPTLGALPEAWGRNWARLGSRFTMVGSPVRATSEGHGAFTVQVDIGSGVAPDWALITSGCATSDSYTSMADVMGASLSWAGRGTRALLPLGAVPLWLTAGAGAREIRLQGAVAACELHPPTVQLLRLVR